MATTISRVLHPLRARLLTVAAVTDVTPLMRRIHLDGELDDFPSGTFSPGDHVRLVLPDETGAVHLPAIVDDRPVPGPVRPVTRDYTPQLLDGRLVLDVATGHQGAASLWAAQVSPGSPVGVVGPRGSLLMPTDCPRYVVIADETALPAAAVWISEAPRGAEVVVLLHCPGHESYFDTTGIGTADIRWCTDEAMVLSHLTSFSLDGAFVWAAGEAAQMADIRHELDARGVQRSARSINGYWRRGEVDFDHHVDLDPAPQS